MKSIFRYQQPTLWWSLFILIICNISFGSVGKSHLFFAGFDKLVHCGLFFVFVTFNALGLIRNYGPQSFTFFSGVKLFALAIIYGVIIELLQLYVFTWRSAELADLFADSVGAGMGVFSAWIILYASAHAKN